MEYTFRQKLAFALLGTTEKQKEVILAIRDKMNDESTAEMILEILNGEKYVPDCTHEYFKNYYDKRKKFFELNKCTEREIEIGKICILAEKGLSQKRIASELGMTSTQINTRCKRYSIKTIGKWR